MKAFKKWQFSLKKAKMKLILTGWGMKDADHRDIYFHFFGVLRVLQNTICAYSKTIFEKVAFCKIDHFPRPFCRPIWSESFIS